MLVFLYQLLHRVLFISSVFLPVLTILPPLDVVSICLKVIKSVATYPLVPSYSTSDHSSPSSKTTNLLFLVSVFIISPEVFGVFLKFTSVPEIYPIFCDELLFFSGSFSSLFSTSFLCIFSVLTHPVLCSYFYIRPSINFTNYFNLFFFFKCIYN